MPVPYVFQPGLRLIDGSQLNANFSSASGSSATSGAGAAYYVDETNGADANNGGQNPNTPLKTLSKALTLESNALSQLGLTGSGRQSIVYLVGTVHTSATINWNLNGTHLIGLSAPSDNDRSRISQTGSVVFTPLVNVTGVGCRFENIATFHGFNNNSAQICWAEAGGRNYYQNCQFLGMGDATAAAHAGSRSLVVSSGENQFVNCTYGLDTVVRATGTNATLEFTTGAPRNIFNGGVFQMLTTNAANVHVTAGASGLDRYALFNGTIFINAIESTSTTINAAVTANASAGGAVILAYPTSLGATALATTGPVYLVGSTPVATTSGIAIKAT